MLLCEHVVTAKVVDDPGNSVLSTANSVMYPRTSALRTNAFGQQPLMGQLPLDRCPSRHNNASDGVQQLISRKLWILTNVNRLILAYLKQKTKPNNTNLVLLSRNRPTRLKFFIHTKYKVYIATIGVILVGLPPSPCSPYKFMWNSCKISKKN